MFEFDGALATGEYGHYYDSTGETVTQTLGMVPPPTRPIEWFGAIPTGAAESLASRFARLRDMWLEDVAFVSDMEEIIESEPYQEIVLMGPAVVSLILSDMEQEPKPWFFALYCITGADPVRARDAGNMRKMAEAWLKWGEEQGYR